MNEQYTVCSRAVTQEEIAWALIDATRDPELKIRQFASRTLRDSENLQMRRALIEMLQSSNVEGAFAAAEILSEIARDETAEVLGQALFTAEDSHTKVWAIQFLARIGGPKALEVLMYTLSGSDLWVKREAANALSKIGSIETLETLIRSPEIDIHEGPVFSLARTLAIRFSRERPAFFPVYPERVANYKHSEEISLLSKPAFERQP
jgi:hypothetical protein